MGDEGPIEVWLTGFGAFPGAAANPSQSVVSRILRDSRRRLTRSGIRLETDILPVVYDEGCERAARSRLAAAPDVVLHLGLAGRRRAISVETRAANRVSTLHADAAGRRAPVRRLDLEGEAWRHSPSPGPRLAAAINLMGVPARISIDAGDYVCNQQLYRSLGREEGLVAFVHLPRPLAERRARRDRDTGGGRRIRLSQMQRAIEQVILMLAREARRRRRRSAAAPDAAIRSAA